MNIPSTSDIVVLRRADSSIVLRVTGYDARVLVIVPKRIKEHDALLDRVVEVLTGRATTASPDAATERIPISPRV